MMKKAGHDYEPAVYTNGERDFEKLCARDDIDLVYTATPWRWHVPVAMSAMKKTGSCETFIECFARWTPLRSCMG